MDFLDNRRALFAIKSAAINRDLPNLSRDKFFNYYDGTPKRHQVLTKSNEMKEAEEGR